MQNEQRMKKVLSEFISVREGIKNGYQAKYASPHMEIGEFSYGVPKITGAGKSDGKLTIGKFCSIASEVSIFLGAEHRTDWITTFPFNVFMPSYSYIKGHPCSKGDVVIGNDVWIASGVKILSGVTIGNGCVIAANALVTGTLEPYGIYGGVPAKLIKMRFDESIINKLQEIEWWNWSDSDICHAIPLLQSNDMDALFMYYENIKR